MEASDTEHLIQEDGLPPVLPNYGGMNEGLNAAKEGSINGQVNLMVHTHTQHWSDLCVMPPSA